MTTVLGLLFSRWTLLLVAVLLVVALVGAQKLVYNRYSVGGLVLLALGIGLWTWHDAAVKADRVATAAPWIKLIKDNNDAAEAKLAVETAKTAAETKALKEFSIQQEGIDHANDQTIVSLNAKLRATRLRDPGKAGGCSGGATGANPASASAGAADAGQGSGLLSESASNFLWDQALAADRINEAYRSCRAYAQAVREAIAIADAEPLVLAMALSMADGSKIDNRIVDRRIKID